jgi:pyruvate formate lyase activating enzyme
MIEARFYALEDAGRKTVRCALCPHNCLVAPGKTGLCRARKNIDGRLFSLTYGVFSSVGMDPVEKKPLYHFFPGRKLLSLGTTGCNFRCACCQNYGISQAESGEVPVRELSPEDAVMLCRRNGSFGIAYTYNEPLVNYEWLSDCARLAGENGLKSVLVTNGYINEEPLAGLLRYVDAANIDVKSFRDGFYSGVCSGKLGPVLRTVEIMAKQGKHIELTYLVIPGRNDSSGEIRDLADWISSVSPDIPLHFSRYFPRYKMTEAATPTETLEKARKIALGRLKYVYLGNIPGPEYGRTYCPGCGAVLVERAGFESEIQGLSGEGSCERCGTEANIRLN